MGMAYWGTTPSRALSTCGIADCVWHVTGQTSFTASTTLPANIKVAFEGSGTFTIPQGVTVTINGPVVASARAYIFHLSGSGAVALPSSAMAGQIPGDWFGSSSASTPVPLHGIWNSGGVYNTGDAALYNGQAYGSVINGNTGNTPAVGSAYWALLTTSTPASGSSYLLIPSNVVSSNYSAHFFGDSITCGEGSSTFSGSVGQPDVNSNGSPNNGWAWLVGSLLGGTADVQCQGGDTMTDILTGRLLQSTLSPNLSGNAPSFMLAGINDANVYGTGAGEVANFTAEIGAAVAYATSPTANKVMLASSACTQTAGSGSGVHFNSNPLGTYVRGLSLGSNGDSVSCIISTGGGPLALVYRVINSNSTGTFSVTIDGTARGSLVSNGFGGVTVSTPYGSGQTEFAQMYTGLAAGPHTVVMTNTGSTVTGIDYLATPYFGTAGVQSPRLVFMGPPYYAPTPGVSVLYAAAQGAVSAYASEGWPVAFGDTRAGMDGTNDFLATTVTCRDGSTAPGTTESGHPNDCGYKDIRDVALRALASLVSR